MTKRRIVLRCAVCSGTGWVAKPANRLIRIMCRICNGTGKVIVNQ